MNITLKSDDTKKRRGGGGGAERWNTNGQKRSLTLEKEGEKKKIQFQTSPGMNGKTRVPMEKHTISWMQ